MKAFDTRCWCWSMVDQTARLLIVDDNKVNRLLLSRYLELDGHHFALAENGQVALEKLRQEPFDLLLLDIEMPVMNGFEVLEKVKADPDLRDIPVIVTSSLEGLENIVQCIGLGAEDYLPKPLNRVLLKARIGASLEKKRLRDEQRELVRRFATAEVEQDLHTSGFALGGKRVHVSVMFCDIRDFTPLCESQNPEETIELLNHYYLLMFEAISNHGGIVTLMVGDGLMAVFGAPSPLEDCAGSAVNAAMEMIGLIERFNTERAELDKVPIHIGIGIATGEVIAGYAGTEKRATYTCIGDTVNLASRLETHTKVAQRRILIDGATCRSLDAGVPTEELGDVKLKGKAAAVRIFAIAAEATA